MIIFDDNYICGLSPMVQLLAWIISALLYVVGGGFCWALTPERWSGRYDDDPSRHIATIFWPLTLAGYMVYLLACLGPRFVEWKKRPKIPEARVVK